MKKTPDVKAKVVVGSYLSRNKKRGGLCNTYHALLSDRWLVKRSRFYAS